MSQQSVTKSGYVRQIFGSMRKHSGEPALVLAGIITIVIYFWAVSAVHLRTSALLPVVVAMLLLQLVVAAWRVYRTQHIVITTKQTLLDLDGLDRAESEQRLRAHYVHREERNQQRYELHLEKLTENISALTARLRGAQ